MKKMQYNAPLTDVKTVAMVSMLCASAAGGGSGETATIEFKPTTTDLTAD